MSLCKDSCCKSCKKTAYCKIEWHCEGYDGCEEECSEHQCHRFLPKINIVIEIVPKRKKPLSRFWYWVADHDVIANNRLVMAIFMLTRPTYCDRCQKRIWGLVYVDDDEVFCSEECSDAPKYSEQQINELTEAVKKGASN